MKSGRFMLRVKSSLSAKRVKQDPAFIPLMEDAVRMKVASPLAARVYKELGIRNVGIYRKMTGRAKGLLKEGISEADIEVVLRREYGSVEKVVISAPGSEIILRKENGPVEKVVISAPGSEIILRKEYDPVEMFVISAPGSEIILRKEYDPVEMFVISTGKIYPVREVPVVTLYHAAVYINSA
jgi:hypothetical protein